MKAAYATIGINENTDGNAGSNLGLSEVVESRINGSRVVASDSYPLHGVQLMPDTLVKRVLIEGKYGKMVATGVELADGKLYHAKREVILSAGAFRTPQLLMLSGIGAGRELQSCGVTQIVNAPEVGKNLHDHLGVKQWWRLQNPEAGHSLGSPGWNDPKYQYGNPIDWTAVQTVPHAPFKTALSINERPVSDFHPLLLPQRSHISTYIQYVAANETNPTIPLDGSHITSLATVLLPTSRGTVTLGSANPADAPVIDPNYYASEADRYRVRMGVRTLVHVLRETSEGKALIAGETVPDGYKPLTAYSTDEEIDARVKHSVQ